jgi:hypothetical protein
LSIFYFTDIEIVYSRWRLFTFHILHDRLSSDNLITNTLELRKASRDQERVLGIHNDSLKCLISDCSVVGISDDGETADARGGAREVRKTRNEAEIEEIVVVLRKAEQSEGQHTFRPVLLMVVENT